jgi:hypothetical protein
MLARLCHAWLLFMLHACLEDNLNNRIEVALKITVLNLSIQPTVWMEILGTEPRSQFLTHEQGSRRH